MTASTTDDEDHLPPLESYFLTVNKYNDTASLIPISTTGVNPNNHHQEEDIDLGSLVHHASVPISSNECLLLGDGVTSFTVGDTFTKYVLFFRLEDMDSFWFRTSTY